MKPAPESDQEHIAHMLGCIARVRDYTQGQRSVFDGSSLVQDGVLRNLQTLTEPSQRLSDGAKASEPGIDWRRMAGMRNILVHAYLSGIVAGTVWAVIERSCLSSKRPFCGSSTTPAPSHRCQNTEPGHRGPDPLPEAPRLCLGPHQVALAVGIDSQWWGATIEALILARQFA